MTLVEAPAARALSAVEQYAAGGHERELMIPLPGGNIYYAADGEDRGKYLVGHLNGLSRNSPDNWNSGRFDETETGKEPSPYRQAFLEFAYNYSIQRGGDISVVSLSAGSGPESGFTTLLPGVGSVTAVDFSERALERAATWPTLKEHKYTQLCMSNDVALNHMEPGSVDLIVAHGGFVENTPKEDDVYKTIELAGSRLKDGGMLWLVGLAQPGLTSEYDDQVAIDIMGVTPHPPGTMLRAVMEPRPAQESLHVKLFHSEVRAHAHAIPELGDDIITHGHTYERLVVAKGSEGLRMASRGIGLLEPHNPAWTTTWQKLVTDRNT